ncbi:hypothetical protein K458DRAFT_419447 [Lentithecium fluviatile CBS 122367]|uniref:Uncharacterized protein n=1 Tax=Lentithecium fluviatile CBS 122367 TaxID=1168545 RepID=A0A6G1IWH9_9PLEO|nr:hypothetical protein K458DRAFT_419447 [Lentithecium fluviatile CBS 122367]
MSLDLHPFTEYDTRKRQTTRTVYRSAHQTRPITCIYGYELVPNADISRSLYIDDDDTVTVLAQQGDLLIAISHPCGNPS